MQRSLAILGSTGALGRVALSEALAHPDLLRVTALAAGRSVAALASQAEAVCRVWGALPTLGVTSDADAEILRSGLLPVGQAEIRTGEEGLARIASEPGVDIVLGAVSGLAGLASAEAAARAGRLLVLATKEVLALAGAALAQLAATSGGRLEPLDSELTAASRLIRLVGTLRPGAPGRTGHRLLLTASGGPLWLRPSRDLAGISPTEVLSHPVWPLGPKIAVDSATGLNKAQEVVAASQLFGLDPDDILVTIHPEAKVHAVLGLPDGAELAFAAPPDMRGALRSLLGLGAPDPSRGFALSGSLTMAPPDLDRFPGIALGHRAICLGAGGRAALVGANEAAASAFLAGRLPFPEIAAVVSRGLDEAETCRDTLAELRSAALTIRREWARRLGTDP